MAITIKTTGFEPISRKSRQRLKRTGEEITYNDEKISTKKSERRGEQRKKINAALEKRGHKPAPEMKPVKLRFGAAKSEKQAVPSKRKPHEAVTIKEGRIVKKAPLQRVKPRKHFGTIATLPPISEKEKLSSVMEKTGMTKREEPRKEKAQSFGHYEPKQERKK